ncbi:MAG: hypothetical protein ACFHVJ_10040 [Aestuariibacter sp.]
MRQANLPTFDKLESKFFIGTGNIPKCLLPPRKYVGVVANVNKKKLFWTASTYSNEINFPHANKKFEVRVLDYFGDPVPPENFYLNINEGTTDSRGYFFSDEAFYIPKTIGVYLLEVKYRDKNTYSYSYSIPIISLSDDEFDEADRLFPNFQILVEGIVTDGSIVRIKG